MEVANVPKLRELLYSTTGTLEFWCRPNFSGSDGQYHEAIRLHQYNATNRISLGKNSSDQLGFYVELNDINTAAITDISSWSAGNWYHIVGLWDKNTLDGTDYSWLYINNSEAASSSVKIENAPGIGSNLYFGENQNLNVQFDGSLHGRVWNIALPTTRAAAETAGISPWCSVEGLFSEGSGFDCPVNENLLFKIIED